jgi:hypothetical protein
LQRKLGDPSNPEQGFEQQPCRRRTLNGLPDLRPRDGC